MEPIIGSPPQTIRDWMLTLARENDDEAKRSWWYRRAYLRGRASAFKEVWQLLAQVYGDSGVIIMDNEGYPRDLCKRTKFVYSDIIDAPPQELNCRLPSGHSGNHRDGPIEWASL